MKLTKLKTLSLSDSKSTDPNFLSKLTNLSHLDLRRFPINDASLSHLTDLTYLSLPRTAPITNEGLRNLTKLTVFKFDFDHCSLSDEVFSYFTNLSELDLPNCNLITDNAAKYLSNLQKLSLSKSELTNDFLKELVSLKYLDLFAPKHINDDGLSTLTSLTSLEIEATSMVSAKSLKKLTNLTSLGFFSCPEFVLNDNALSNLTNFHYTSASRVRS